MFTSKPLLGVGLNNFPSLYQEYTKTLGLAPSATSRAPHNLYLEVAAEQGIAGLAIFLIMVWLAFRSTLHAIRKFREVGMEDYANMATGFAIAFMGYMFSAVFVHAAYPRYFYLLLGIAYALPMIVEYMQVQQQNETTRFGITPSYDHI
jgi:O-antigen ligase